MEKIIVLVVLASARMVFAAPGDSWILPLDHTMGTGFTALPGAGYEGDDALDSNGPDGARRVYWNTSNVIPIGGAPAAMPTSTELYTIQFFAPTAGGTDWQPIESQFNGSAGETYPFEPNIPWAGEYGTNHQYAAAGSNHSGTFLANGAGPHCPRSVATDALDDGIYMWLKGGTSWLYAKWDYSWSIHRSWSAIKLTQITGELVNTRADSARLYGIHWWGYTQGQNIDQTPAGLLECADQGAWDLETVLTSESYVWGPWYILPLYLELSRNQNVSIITRIDYQWAETIPAPQNPDAASWPAAVVDLVNTLRNSCHIWVIGNEPNQIGAHQNWPDGNIPPEGYAAVYRAVREAIHTSALPSPLGPHIVLFAAVAPNPTSNDYLSRAIDSVPLDTIDGFAIHAYARMWISFHDEYALQLELIDSKGLRGAPAYMTEMGIYAQPGNPDEEAAAAQFCREAFADVNQWNQGLGHHNIIGMTWYVYDSNQQGMDFWNAFSLEYYKADSSGYPLGDPRNLFTAFGETVQLHYPAGIVGTRGWPVAADFNQDGQVDEADCDHFAMCATGPGIPQLQPECLNTRLDGDDYVDQSDFGLFQRCLSGTRPADPNCAN